MAALNSKGEESEQSKERRGANADKYAKGSAKRASQEIKLDESTKKSALDRIMAEGNLTPSRQQNPPQTGPGAQTHDDENLD